MLRSGPKHRHEAATQSEKKTTLLLGIQKGQTESVPMEEKL